MPSGRPAIMGASEIPPGRWADREYTAMHAEVGAAALADAGVAPDEVEGLLCAGPMIGEGSLFLSEDVQDYLGLSRLGLEVTMQLGGGSHLAMVRHAVNTIAAGEVETVLCVSCGRFPPLKSSGRTMMEITCHPEFELPYAPSIPTLYGLIARRWMHETGATEETLAQVVVSQDRWAKLHPHALGRDGEPVTEEAVLASKPIAGPFRYLDCSIPCEGGTAMVLGSADRAGRGPNRPVHVLGAGEFHTHGFLSSMTEPGRTGAATSGPLALERAGRTHADIDVLELYDAFSSNPAMILEEAGFLECGGADAAYRDGRCSPAGDLPTNTYGGLVRYGHMGTASGFTQILEAYRQLSGRPIGEAVPGADTAFVHAYGSMLCSHVSMVLEGA